MQLCTYVWYHDANNVSTFGGDPVTELNLKKVFKNVIGHFVFQNMRSAGYHEKMIGRTYFGGEQVTQLNLVLYNTDTVPSNGHTSLSTALVLYYTRQLCFNYNIVALQFVCVFNLFIIIIMAEMAVV